MLNCALHKKNQLTHFCQTCLDVICMQCKDQHPHSDQFHVIRPIEQSANERRKYFDNIVATQINPIKKKIGEKLKQLKKNEQDKIQQKNVIIKDILLQFQSIQVRVKENQHKKALQLQTQIKYYEDYLNILDDLAFSFQKTMRDPYNFLILYKDFNKNLEKLQSKIIDLSTSTKIQWLKSFKGQLRSQQINQIKNNQKIAQNKDFELIPRQIKETYNFIETLKSFHQRNCLINSLLVKSSLLYKQQLKKSANFNQNQTKRILHFYNQANQNVLTLKAAKTCCYCQTSFSIQTCNDQCSQNRSFKSQLSPNYVNIIIPIEAKGSKRHYWVNSQICNRKRPQASSHPLTRNKLKKQFLNSLQDMRIVECSLRKYQIQKKEDYIKAFQKEDKDKSKRLSKIKFKYILTKVFQIKQVYSQLLIDLLWKQQQIKIQKIGQGQQKRQKQHKIVAGVDYQGLIQIIQNPLFYYNKYLKEEEQFDKKKPIAPQSVAKKYYY